jgi:nucleoid DNA-binding protein
MTKSEIIDRLATGTGLTRYETEVVVNGFLGLIASSLKRGEPVELRGFGSFRVRDRAERTARNPKTGEEMVIPGRAVPVFRPSRDLKDSVEEAYPMRDRTE